MPHTYVLLREQWIPRPVDAVFPFFSDARNLQAITPPWLRFRIVAVPDCMERGAGIEYELAWRFLRLHWKTLITEWNPPHRFVDVQASGPYRFWEHTHTFQPSAGGTRMFDSVRYALPLGVLGRLAHRLRVRHDLERIFDYRELAIQRLFGAATG